MGVMEQWKDKKIGVVLSGGGAKGAYQAGMFRALEELGLASQITAFAGTSIGALDGLLYAAVGLDGVNEMLHCFGSQITEQCRQTDVATVAASKEAVKQGGVSVAQFCEDPAFCEFSNELFRDSLRKWIPDEKLMQGMKPVYVCAYSLEHARPEYFKLNDLQPQQQRDLTLASASLPYVFPPIAYGDSHYLDGGVIPQVCKTGAQKADKIPLKPMLEEDVDVILVNFLIPSDTIDHSAVPSQVKYVELRPSCPLETYPGEGTLDFSPERLRSHEALGYQDTMELFLGRPALQL